MASIEDEATPESVELFTDLLDQVNTFPKALIMLYLSMSDHDCSNSEIRNFLLQIQGITNKSEDTDGWVVDKSVAINYFNGGLKKFVQKGESGYSLQGKYKIPTLVFSSILIDLAMSEQTSLGDLLGETALNRSLVYRYLLSLQLNSCRVKDIADATHINPNTLSELLRSMETEQVIVVETQRGRDTSFVRYRKTSALPSEKPPIESLIYKSQTNVDESVIVRGTMIAEGLFFILSTNENVSFEGIILKLLENNSDLQNDGIFIQHVRRVLDYWIQKGLIESFQDTHITFTKHKQSDVRLTPVGVSRIKHVVDALDRIVTAFNMDIRYYENDQVKSHILLLIMNDQPLMARIMKQERDAVVIHNTVDSLVDLFILTLGREEVTAEDGSELLHIKTPRSLSLFAILEGYGYLFTRIDRRVKVFSINREILNTLIPLLDLVRKIRKDDSTCDSQRLSVQLGISIEKAEFLLTFSERTFTVEPTSDEISNVLAYLEGNDSLDKQRMSEELGILQGTLTRILDDLYQNRKIGNKLLVKINTPEGIEWGMYNIDILGKLLLEGGIVVLGKAINLNYRDFLRRIEPRASAEIGLSSDSIYITAGQFQGKNALYYIIKPLTERNPKELLLSQSEHAQVLERDLMITICNNLLGYGIIVDRLVEKLLLKLFMKLWQVQVVLNLSILTYLVVF